MNLYYYYYYYCCYYYYKRQQCIRLWKERVMAAIYTVAGDWKGRRMRAWQLRWYIIIEVEHNNQLLIPYNGR